MLSIFEENHLGDYIMRGLSALCITNKNMLIELLCIFIKLLNPLSSTNHMSKHIPFLLGILSDSDEIEICQNILSTLLQIHHFALETDKLSEFWSIFSQNDGNLFLVISISCRNTS